AGATGVSTTAPNITATFSKPVVASTISFVLKNGANTVPGTVAYNSSTNVVSFTPGAALAASTTYTATVSGAQDTAGVPMAPFSGSFTTGAPDTTPPTLAATSPAAGATLVWSGSAVTATFSEPVQAGTINFTLKDGANNPVA